MNSLTSISRFIDPLTPPRNLSEVFRRHSWPGAARGVAPQAPKSLASVARRYSRGIQLRFLWYNTFLLPGVRIPVNVAVDKAGYGALAAYGVTMNAALIGQLGLAAAASSLIPGVGVALAAVIAAFGIETILKKLHVSPSDVLRKLGIDFGDVSFGAKPELAARAREIGAVVARDYDIAALGEVWEQRERDALLESARGSGRVLESVVGPEKSGDVVLLGSGLCTLSLGRHIAGTRTKVFDNRGDRLRDTDAWANKGILLTVVDVGFGALEIYSTHLYNGGDMPVLTPSASEKLENQKRQLSELVAFFRETHDVHNVALLVGDFNIDGIVHPEVVDAMAQIGMHDTWALASSSSGGYTNRNADDTTEPIEPDFNKVCKGLGSPGSDFCDERQASTGGPAGGRLDYLFIEQPSNQHQVLVDVSRVRRRAFQRSSGGERTLSDHMGLDVNLLVAPI